MGIERTQPHLLASEMSLKKSFIFINNVQTIVKSDISSQLVG